MHSFEINFPTRLAFFLDWLREHQGSAAPFPDFLQYYVQHIFARQTSCKCEKRNHATRTDRAFTCYVHRLLVRSNLCMRCPSFWSCCYCSHHANKILDKVCFTSIICSYVSFIRKSFVGKDCIESRRLTDRKNVPLGKKDPIFSTLRKAGLALMRKTCRFCSDWNLTPWRQQVHNSLSFHHVYIFSIDSGKKHIFLARNTWKLCILAVAADLMVVAGEVVFSSSS